MEEKKETPLLLPQVKVTREQRDWLDKEAALTGESMASIQRRLIQEKIKGERRGQKKNS